MDYDKGSGGHFDKTRSKDAAEEGEEEVVVWEKAEKTWSVSGPQLSLLERQGENGAV